MPLLVLGIGQQGGEVKSTVKAAIDSRGWGMIVSSSRTILYASSDNEYQQASRAETIKLRSEINRFR
jgi:orotidine-5'-phosphate decarboxylase